MHLWTYLFGGLYMISSLFRFSKYMIDKHGAGALLLTKADQKHRLYEYLYSTLHSIGITTLASLSYQKDLFTLHDPASYRVNDGMKLTMGVSFSYFLLDLFQCQNQMYVVHHLCALQLIGSSMMRLEEQPYRASYLMAMLALFEWNTPIFNLGFLCRDLKLHYTVLGSVWTVNLVLYTLSRLVMIPMLLYYYQWHENEWIHMNIDSNIKRTKSEIDWMDYLSLGIIYGGSFYWAIRQTQGIWKHVVKRIPSKHSSNGGSDIPSSLRSTTDDEQSDRSHSRYIDPQFSEESPGSS